MTVINADCIEHMNTMPPDSVDSIVTDPPYHLTSIVKRFGKEGSAPAQFGTDGAYARASKGFMGKVWDGGDIAFRTEVWEAALRVAKPGAHLLAFGGTRTFHRLAVAIEDAGWEIRDTVMWVYGSGFPKSHNAGNGWGTALKPAWEPIIVARKPLEGTVAANVLAHGTGALNIDGCRVGTDAVLVNNYQDAGSPFGDKGNGAYVGKQSIGRWPANLIHDGSDEVLAGFPVTKAGVAVRGNGGGNTFGSDKPKPPMEDIGYGDTGSAARFFYCAKASKADRDAGCEGMQAKQYSHDGRETPIENAYQRNDSKSRNHHPTVKPTALMRYLCKLVTPPAGTVLDPFMGSGSTGKAAVLEGFGFIGIEQDAEYVDIARARIAHAVQNLHELQ